MAEFPNASPMGLPRSVEQPDIKPTIVIVHTYVGNPSLASNLAAMEPLSFTGEHHFYMRVGGDELAQFLSTTTRADNNFRANSFMSHGHEVRGGLDRDRRQVQRRRPGPAAVVVRPRPVRRARRARRVVLRDARHPGAPVPEPDRARDRLSLDVGLQRVGSGEGTYGHIIDSKGRRIRLNNPWTNIVGKTCPGPGKTAEFPNLLDAVARRVGSRHRRPPPTTMTPKRTRRCAPCRGPASCAPAPR